MNIATASVTSQAIAIASQDSNVDTILTLPEHTSTFALAEACRSAALMFLNEAPHWGKAELAMWLMGPYTQLTRYVPAESRAKSGEFTRPVPLLRDIDVRMVERIISGARQEVLATLARISDMEGGASFSFSMISGGFVARCEDRRQFMGWVPTTTASRLADRVLSLIAADYLTRPEDYELELSVCSHCGTVDIDASARARGICNRHRSDFFAPQSRRLTQPFLPEGA
jgi:hypothetical protein